MIPFMKDEGVDAVTARLTAGEAAVLSNLAGQLVAMLEGRAGESPADVLYAQVGIGGSTTAPLDPALARLLPDAYRDDREAASEHRHFTELALIDRKIANARTVIESVASRAITLDGAAVNAWLRCLTDLRLVIAARLQIETDDDEGTGDDAMLAAYDWLGYLQGSLIEVIE